MKSAVCPPRANRTRELLVFSYKEDETSVLWPPLTHFHKVETLTPSAGAPLFTPLLGCIYLLVPGAPAAPFKCLDTIRSLAVMNACLLQKGQSVPLPGRWRPEEGSREEEAMAAGSTYRCRGEQKITRGRKGRGGAPTRAVSGEKRKGSSLRTAPVLVKLFVLSVARGHRCSAGLERKGRKILPLKVKKTPKISPSAPSPPEEREY